MRIAIDARPLTGRFTGDRTNWSNLIRALAQVAPQHELVLFSRSPIETTEFPIAANVHSIVVAANNERTWSTFALPRAAKIHAADLLHVQYTIPPRILCSCPVVTTVHDISFNLYPEWFPRKDRILMNLTVPRSMRAANHVITDSESSRRDIQRVYQLPESQISAIPLGLSHGFDFPDYTMLAQRISDSRAFLATKAGITEPFILALGVLQPRKNLMMLAAAYGKLRKQYGLPHRLVLVGKSGWITAQNTLLAEVEQEGGSSARDGVMFAGYVPDQDLPAWYSACSLFVHPSLYEGFGIPPLEAMACSAPVLVSDAPAMPEVVGDSAMVVSAKDPDAWARAMHTMLTDQDVAERYRERGPVRAARFSWLDTARRTLNVYEEIVE